jgi:hypothetical protein
MSLNERWSARAQNAVNGLRQSRVVEVLGLPLGCSNPINGREKSITKP